MHAVSTNQIADILHFNDSVFNGRYQNSIIALILWQYLKIASFLESIEALLTVNENFLQHSLELGNYRDGYYPDVDNSAFQLL